MFCGLLRSHGYAYVHTICLYIWVLPKKSKNKLRSQIIISCGRRHSHKMLRSDGILYSIRYIFSPTNHSLSSVTFGPRSVHSVIYACLNETELSLMPYQLNTIWSKHNRRAAIKKTQRFIVSADLELLFGE